MTDDAYVHPYPHKPPITWPGVTIQDIRMAYRIEKLWEMYWEGGKARLPQKGWKFPGNPVGPIRKWGLIAARLWPKKHRRNVLRAAGRIPQPVIVNGKKRIAKKKKTPRWKKFKWKNQARRRQKREEKTAPAGMAVKADSARDVTKSVARRDAPPHMRRAARSS